MSNHDKEITLDSNSCRIKGLSKQSLLDDTYFSFQNIPYAKNPVGPLRFKAPVPVDSCPSDTIDARFEGPVPYYVESHFEGYAQSENCLHLNVYSKNINPITPLAVIVFIYGGGFNSGSSMTKLYGPDYFMQKDVVLVTFNYRVGPLGFLHFDDPSIDVPGNAGLKDQLLVLKWVQNNIENFGGNKNNVTLVGDSAGAGSVSYHLASEAAKGLFHRAILMSGTTFCSWGVMPPNHLGFYLANATGWNGNGGEKGAYQHLLSVDPETITKASMNILTEDHYKHGLQFPFGPMVESYDSESSFIREYPVKLLRNAWSKDIDIVIGHTSNEGLMDAQRPDFETLRDSNEPHLFLPYEATSRKSNTELATDVQKIKNLYNNFQDLSKNNKKSFFEFISDSRFVHGAHRNILSRLNHPSSAKTYAYRFSYDFPNRNHHKKVFGATELQGASHADDISYIFTNNWAPVPDKNTKEWQAIQKMVDFFTGFAIEGRQAMQKIGWDEINKADLPYDYQGMEINQKWQMQKMPELTRMRSWDELFQESDLY